MECVMLASVIDIPPRICPYHRTVHGHMYITTQETPLLWTQHKENFIFKSIMWSNTTICRYASMCVWGWTPEYWMFYQ